MAKQVNAFLDADYLAYMAGYVVQTTYYLVVYALPKRGKKLGPLQVWGEYDSAEGRDKGTAELENEHPTAEVRVWKRVAYKDDWDKAEAVRQGHQVIDAQVTAIYDAVAEKFDAEVDLGVYLTGFHNYRELVATIKPYKGHRTQDKPLVHKEMREYLLDRWQAKLIHHREADDEVAILQAHCTAMKKASVICGIDKDLWQVPGWHYNPNKRKFARVTRPLGDRLFYRQILTGDTADNIPGCYRIGESAAKKMITKGMSVEQMYNICLTAYAQSIEKYGEKTNYAHMTPEEAVRENAILLYMLRDYNDEWQPPGTPLPDETDFEDDIPF